MECWIEMIRRQKERAKEVAELDSQKQVKAEAVVKKARNEGVAIQKDNERLIQKQATLQSDNRVLEQTHDKIQQDNSQLEEQQEKLKSSMEQMVTSEKMLQRDVRKYDEEPEWQLPEPGAFVSAKLFRDKIDFPLVNKLKELVKSLTIQCVRLKEEVLQLREKIKNLMRDVVFYKGK
jgi:type III secretion system FlhB-like substrate exporter